MSQYVVIRKIAVQNANAVSGLTYGFPAVTHFLGFVHALSRKLPKEWNIELNGVGIVCHEHQVHAKQPKGWGDYVFALTRNPLTKEGNTAPIIEEGRMSFVVSLVIEVAGLFEGDNRTAETLRTFLKNKIAAMRLAGGPIINQPSIEIINVAETMGERKLIRSLMPGFALIDRKEYLTAHYHACMESNSKATLFDAWCDFAALKYKAERVLDGEGNSTNDVNWHYLPKPKPGYLVPLMVGYCAISEVYEPGVVAGVRDADVPAVFAEAAYGVAEWLSPHRLNEHLNSFIWRYRYHAPWYLASSEILPERNEVTEPDTDPY